MVTCKAGLQLVRKEVIEGSSKSECGSSKSGSESSKKGGRSSKSEGGSTKSTGVSSKSLGVATRSRAASLFILLCAISLYCEADARANDGTEVRQKLWK